MEPEGGVSLFQRWVRKKKDNPWRYDYIALEVAVVHNSGTVRESEDEVVERDRFVYFLECGTNLEANVGKRGSKLKKELDGPLPGAVKPIPAAERKRLDAYGHLGVGPHFGREALDQATLALIMDRMAEGTQASYSSQFTWWELFCRARQADPFRIVTNENLKKEEKMFLDFVLHSTAENLWAPGTLKMRLAAIAARHTAAGYPNPLERMPRVYMALDGYKKRYGKDARRRPVTIEMLRWIRRNTDPEHQFNDAAINAAVQVGFFFLLRASEYVKSEGTKLREYRGMRGCDIRPRKGGKSVKNFAAADEVVLVIRGSKTDKFNEGDVKNHFRTNDPEICVIKSLALYQQHAPLRFGEKVVERLFAWDNGALIQRAEVQAVLERAAVGVGVDPQYIGSHSLRFGGATALWAAYGDSAMVQRWGRWASDAFQGYLWEARGNSRGVAEAMTCADVSTI